MSEVIKSELLLLKAEADVLGISIFSYIQSVIIDYNDAVLIADADIRAYHSFTYSEMLGEFKRKIAKQKIVETQTLTTAFMVANF